MDKVYRVRIQLVLTAEREFTEAEMVDLYPESTLGNVRQAVERAELVEAKVDPVQYAEVLLQQGGKVRLGVTVE